MSNKEDYNDGNEYKFDNIEVEKDTHKKVKKKYECFLCSITIY